MALTSTALLPSTHKKMALFQVATKTVILNKEVVRESDQKRKVGREGGEEERRREGGEKKRRKETGERKQEKREKNRKKSMI